MTDWAPMLRRGWGVLSAPRGDALASYPLDIVFHDESVRIAVDQQGHRHLLVPSGEEAVAPDTRPHVLAMKQAAFSFDGDRGRYLDIECGDPDLNAEFDDVVLDVLDAVAGGDSPAAAAAQTIGRWRRLFSAGLRRSLSEQQRVGLFAELSMLRELLVVDPGLQATVWTGPDREPHDFELDRGCIEAKGIGRESNDVRIHGLQQLDEHDGKPLNLVLALVVQDDGGTTLNQLVYDLRERFAQPSQFQAQLTKAGWSVDDPLSAAMAYSVESSHVIRVGPETPRLVRGSLVTDLPESITRVSYAIEVPSLLALAEPSTFQALATELLA